MVAEPVKRVGRRVSRAYGAVLSQRATGSLRQRDEASPYLAEVLRTRLLRAQMRSASARPLSSFPEVERADTLFILGSGESINQLTRADWGRIEAGDLMGLNYSFVHGARPRFHFLELIPDAAMQRFFVERAREHYRDVDVVFQYKHLSRSGFDLRDYPWPERAWVYTPDKLSTSSPEILRFLLERFVRRHPRWREERRLVHHNSHVGAAIMFGHALGYADIVLLGVDLNGGAYFTDSEIESPVFPRTSLYDEINEIRGAFFRRRGEDKLTTHQSMDEKLLRKYGSVDMLTYLRIYREVFPSWPRLYAGSVDSALAEVLPVYPFEANACAS